MVGLHDDSEELKDILKCLEKNKPNITAPIGFRKKLKDRLDSIIALKS
jgi:hypothetical protein